MSVNFSSKNDIVYLVCSLTKTQSLHENSIKTGNTDNLVLRLFPRTTTKLIIHITQRVKYDYVLKL